MALNRSPAFCLKLIDRYLLKTDHIRGDTWGGQFWPKDHNLNKLGREESPSRSYLPNVNALGLVFSDKEVFSCFPYISLCTICDPGEGLYLTPGA